MQQAGDQGPPVLFVCTTCGTQYAASETPPSRCLLCEEEGRATPVARPAWTTLDDIKRRHENIVYRLEQDLYCIRTMPAFPMGHRAMLLRSSGGGILWDCITLVDDTTVGLVHALGGLSAIGVSHPRHCASVVEWSHVFGGIPVYVHATGRRWMMRPDPVVRFWTGERLRLHDDVTLSYCGGDDGGTVLHWPAGAGGRGALLTGDVVQVVEDAARVSFLSSSSTLIPRSARAVERLVRAIDSYVYRRLYDGSPDRVIADNARDVVARSAERYLAAVSGRNDQRHLFIRQRA
ncbi:MAG: MBL fold metallo-hydrolase [Vicinamibacterales bacterium]